MIILSFHWCQFTVLNFNPGLWDESILELWRRFRNKHKHRSITITFLLVLPLVRWTSKEFSRRIFCVLNAAFVCYLYIQSFIRLCRTAKCTLILYPADGQRISHLQCINPRQWQSNDTNVIRIDVERFNLESLNGVNWIKVENNLCAQCLLICIGNEHSGCMNSSYMHWIILNKINVNGNFLTEPVRSCRYSDLMYTHHHRDMNWSLMQTSIV